MGKTQDDVREVCRDCEGGHSYDILYDITRSLTDVEHYLHHVPEDGTSACSSCCDCRKQGSEQYEDNKTGLLAVAVLPEY